MIERYLERLFTWESLKNTERGVEFELKNRLIETEFTGLTAVRFDGEDVPLEDVRLELGDGTVVHPDEVSSEEPLVFELADTMQVIADTDRLTLGSHEVAMGFEVEDYGRVSFTTDDEITEEDLVDADISEMGADEAVALVREIREPVTLRAALEDERAGEGRDEVVEALDERIEETKYIEERREIADDGTRIDKAVEKPLFGVLEGRKRLAVYAALRSLDGGNAEDVAREAGIEDSAAEKTLKDMEMGGTVEYDYANDTYEAVAPSELVRERGRDLLNVLKRSME